MPRAKGSLLNRVRLFEQGDGRGVLSRGPQDERHVGEPLGVDRMLLAEPALDHGQRALLQLLRARVIALSASFASLARQAARHVHGIRAERPLLDSQRARPATVGFGVETQLVSTAAQGVDRRREIGIVEPRPRLANGDRAPHRGRHGGVPRLELRPAERDQAA